MEVQFQKNFIKKGDSDFEYDKRRDFKPANDAVADWDESEAE